MKQDNISDDLLVKYLLNEASETERIEVQNWTQLNETNRKHFEHFKLIWDKSKHLEAKSMVDENAAWERFRQKIEQQHHSPKTTIQPRSFGWLRIAAVLLIMLGGGWLYYNFNVDNPKMLAFNSGSSILTQTLPDGTVVTLNKNSSISYPEAFNGNTRDVKLEGEAFFDVTPDKEHPFIITADDASIKVVGTSFNVKSNVARTEVIVETGIVEVSKKQQMVRLNPKQKATVLKEKDKPVKEEVYDELHNYYRTREFICNATPLYRLVDVLNEVYSADIVIANDRIRDLPLTTTFHNEPLDKILAVIGDTFSLTVEKQGNRIILK